MISAKVIEASVWPTNDGVMVPIHTLEVVMPRIILAEWNTHRKHSKNTSSSRAINLQKMRNAVSEAPFIPRVLGKNQRGMQAGEPLSLADTQLAQALIRAHLDSALELHQRLDMLGVHKQWTNRYLEPWMWTRAVVTSTEWNNFFIQRDHEDAQPEMQDLAIAARCAIVESEPGVRQYHTPYITAEEHDVHPLQACKWVSAFRCAMVSYTQPNAGLSWEQELQKGKDLILNTPPHWSPTEHQANTYNNREDTKPKGNLDLPWIQFRHDGTCHA